MTDLHKELFFNLASASLLYFCANLAADFGIKLAYMRAGFLPEPPSASIW
jgi:hypothetical protein